MIYNIINTANRKIYTPPSPATCNITKATAKVNRVNHGAVALEQRGWGWQLGSAGV